MRPSLSPADHEAESCPCRAAARLLARVRSRRPRVHGLTNAVALELSANVLLAVGAEPSLSGDAATVAEFVRGCDALVVNLGMLDPTRVAAIGAGVRAAAETGRPWLLDPVMVERSSTRRDLARRLLDATPAVVRGNAAEIAALAGTGGDASAVLARRHGCTVAQTGVEDLIVGTSRRAVIANGSPLMTRVTALGCAGSALLGAFLAVEPDPWLAARAALLTLGVAGEVAAERARGPGSFAVEFLDALGGIGEAELVERGRWR